MTARTPRPLAGAWQREPTGTAIRGALGGVLLVASSTWCCPVRCRSGIVLNGAVLGSQCGGHTPADWKA